MFSSGLSRLAGGLGWATLSILWTPYPVSALQHVLKLVLLVATMLAVAAPRDNARATDLYLFPIGVVAGMATMSAKALVETLTGDARTTAGCWPAGSRSRCCCFPALGGLDGARHATATRGSC